MKKGKLLVVAKRFIIPLLIIIVLIITFIEPVNCWFQKNEQALGLIYWIIGIGGVWMISDKIREDIKNRQRDAVFGFYYNLTTLLARVKNKIKVYDNSPYDYYFLKNPANFRITQPDPCILISVNKLSSDLLSFLSTQQNAVPPGKVLNEKDINEWYESLDNVVEFLCKFEDIANGTPIDLFKDKDDYDEYKKSIINSIDIINTQIKVFRNDYLT